MQLLQDSWEWNTRDAYIEEQSFLVCCPWHLIGRALRSLFLLGDCEWLEIFQHIRPSLHHAFFLRSSHPLFAYWHRRSISSQQSKRQNSQPLPCLDPFRACYIPGPWHRLDLWHVSVLALPRGLQLDPRAEPLFQPLPALLLAVRGLHREVLPAASGARRVYSCAARQGDRRADQSGAE